MSEATFFYPELDLQMVKNLEIVRQLQAEHPAYWASSSYSGEVELAVKRLLKVTEKPSLVTSAVPEQGSEGVPKWDSLYKDTALLFKNLKDFDAAGVEPSEKMAYFRTATALMEKMIGLQERALGLKQIHEFQQAVLDVMESVLSPTQRTEVMEQLKSAISTD